MSDLRPVTRYVMTAVTCGNGPEGTLATPNTYGEWVTFTDYEAVDAERRRLKEQVMVAKQQRNESLSKLARILIAHLSDSFEEES